MSNDDHHCSSSQGAKTRPCKSSELTITAYYFVENFSGDETDCILH